MLTSIDVKFIFDSARLLASLGDKGSFSSANILQIVDVVRRVVFLLFMLCFSQKFAYFLLVKGVKSSAILYHYQNNSMSSPGFLG